MTEIIAQIDTTGTVSKLFSDLIKEATLPNMTPHFLSSSGYELLFFFTFLIFLLLVLKKLTSNKMYDFNKKN